MIKKTDPISKKELLSIIESEASGPKSKEYLKQSLEYESLSNNYFMAFKCPPVITKGDGAILWDLDGKEYIDFVSGFSVHNIGHRHPKVIQAIKDQCDRLLQWCALPNELRLELAKKLVEITPGNFRKKVQLLTTGGEAVEFAMRVTRFYTSRPLIMSFYGCYHGTTFGVQNATTHPFFRSYHGFPLNIGVVHVPYAYCYRCFFGKSYPGCGMQCTKYIEELFRNPWCGLRFSKTGMNQIAAILVEPMLGSAGYITPPKEFLPELRRISQKYDVLLIIDEVQTGWGRSGKLWASQYSNVEPDVMTMAKTLGGGFPISAVIGKEEIMDKMGPGGFFSTYGGTPLGCAAALAVIKVFEEEKIVERAEEMGSYLTKRLHELAGRHELIGNIDGTGLYIGIELVKNRQTKEPAGEECEALQNECRKRGLLYEIGGLYGNIAKVICPLSISKEQIDKATEILDESLSVVEHSA